VSAIAIAVAEGSSATVVFTAQTAVTMSAKVVAPRTTKTFRNGQLEARFKTQAFLTC
jgi:hypothetical protein